MHQTSKSTNPTQSNPNHPILDRYAMKRIEFRARRLAIRFNLDDDQREDLAQDMVVELLAAFPRFDETKASRKTFVNRVLDLFSKHTIRTRMNQMKRDFESTVCLHELDESAHPACDGSQGSKLDMKLDIEDIFAQMPGTLQRICILLKSFSVTEVAKILNIHRVTLYRRVLQIRAIFEKAGYSFF